MSLKPKKVSESKKDQQKLNDKMKKKKKELLDDIPPYMFIISEGTKTEVTYIGGFADAINKKYFDFSSENRIKIKGTGKSCRGLLKYAREIVEEEMPQAEIVWLVYDKDDFKDDNFDNTQFSAEQCSGRRKYKVAWSNESLELWFVLHFQDLSNDIGRKDYITILKKKCNYRKNNPDLYKILKPYTEDAIKRAKEQYESYNNDDIDVPPSKRCPATRVYELVEELKKYL